MATTSSLLVTWPIGPYKKQLWRITAGGSDTTATWKTGSFKVISALASPKADEAFGVVINSNDGTEDTVAGDMYLAGVSNSGVYYVEAVVQ